MPRFYTNTANQKTCNQSSAERFIEEGILAAVVKVTPSRIGKDPFSRDQNKHHHHYQRSSPPRSRLHEHDIQTSANDDRHFLHLVPFSGTRWH